MNQPEKGLPANPDAERMILGVVLLDRARLSEAAERLVPGDFILRKHRIIFQRMLELHLGAMAIDTVTLANILLQYGELDACGGVGGLIDLTDGVPAVPSLDQYIKIIKEKSVRRRIIYSAEHLQNLARESVRPQEIISWMASAAADLEIDVTTDSSFFTPTEAFDRSGGVVQFIEGAVEPGISWGWPQFDSHLLGLQPGCQYVIAGYPGSGKSAMSTSVACKLLRRGVSVAILSLEMDHRMLLSRIICSEAEVPLKYYIRHELMKDQRQKVAEAVTRVAEWPLYIDDTPDMTITDVVQRGMQAVAKHKARVVILDHIHHVNYAGERTLKLRNEFEAVTATSAGMLAIARRTQASTIVLSQLSRPDRRGKDKKINPPTMFDLRMSGAIEAHATGVIMIHRPFQWEPLDETRYIADAYIRKSRNGSTGVAYLNFWSSFTTFKDEGRIGKHEDE